MNSSSVPIYLLPGMTPEFPIFVRMLPLLSNASIVRYLQPHKSEPLISYAERMADLMSPQSIVCGVSFGGIVAQEISRFLRPLGCVIISSIRHPRELPPWYRFWRMLGGRNCALGMNLIGHVARLVPMSKRTPSTLRATKLAGPTGKWHRWATSAVLDWNPGVEFDACPVLQIHGSADATFPLRYTRPDVRIRNGSHSLPISHPTETVDAIRAFLETA